MSDWPAALVLDELWLRSRRCGVEALEARQAWPDGPGHDSYVAAAVEQGVELRDGLLTDLLGPDARLLQGETLFGAANRAFRRRLPQVLSFGARLGRTFAALAGAGDESAHQAFDAGAVFNLGVAVLDLVHDTSPDLVAVLPGRLDAAALKGLAAGPDAARDLATTAQASLDEFGAVLPAEIRVLLLLVADFYSRMHVIAGAAGLPEPLVASLADAHRAEMHSLALTGGAKAARASSVAPFLVLAEVALTAAGADESADAACRQRLGQLADAVGEVFWLVDDLVDTVPDAQTGSLNALLETARCANEFAPANLLRSDAIEVFADRLGEAVVGVDDLLAEPDWLDMEAAEELRALVLHGVRSWMG